MTQTDRGRALDAIDRLVTVMRIDPVYRDLYLRRGRALLERVCTSTELARLHELEHWVRQAQQDTRAAVLSGNWPQVKQLVAGIVSARRTLAAQRTALELAASIYDPGEVPLDPFSPGLESLVPGHPAPGSLLASVQEGLAVLEGLDPEGAPLYRARRRYFEALPVGPGTQGQAESPTDPAHAVVEALEDLRRGEIEELGRLAQRMLSRPAGVATTADGPFHTSGADAPLAAPFPVEAVERARSFGLVAVTLAAEPAVADYVRRVAWIPDFAQRELLQASAARVEAARADPVLRGFREPARETLTLFALHPYVNSGGARYLPRPSDETVLVEEFHEEETPAQSPLLAALGLRARRGLARVAIESALLAMAPEVLERRLGLDPIDYQLVCVPPDVYNRAGALHGWGRARLWTHFDGYQLMQSGHLRALVGGDVRYGGRADLVSIARDDARENVIVRLAVVRRERLLGRSAARNA